MHFNINFTPADTGLNLFDVQMPKCGPREICNIHRIETPLDRSANNIRWVIMASLEPRDRFERDGVHTQYQNDVFYKKVYFSLATGTFNDANLWSDYPFPIAFPYEKMRWATRTSSVATGTTWDIIIFYTIEPIDPKQLTAITIRRGTVKHARAQGPEP